MSVVLVASQAALARRESVEVMTMFPYAETSFCAPRREVWLTSFGAPPLRTSQTEKPLSLPWIA